jgi:hypothetical protein
MVVKQKHNNKFYFIYLILNFSFANFKINFVCAVMNKQFDNIYLLNIVYEIKKLNFTKYLMLNLNYRHIVYLSQIRFSVLSSQFSLNMWGNFIVNFGCLDILTLNKKSTEI